MRHQVSVLFVSITVCHNRSLGDPKTPVVAGREQAGGKINLVEAERGNLHARDAQVAGTTTGRRAAPDASAEGARQKRNPGTRPLLLVKDKKKWRRHPDSNRGITVLQTVALPLGYAASDRSPSLSLFSPTTPTAATAGAQLSRRALIKSRFTEQYFRHPANVHVDVGKRTTPKAQAVITDDAST